MLLLLFFSIEIIFSTFSRKIFLIIADGNYHYYIMWNYLGFMLTNLLFDIFIFCVKNKKYYFKSNLTHQTGCFVSFFVFIKMLKLLCSVMTFIDILIPYSSSFHCSKPSIMANNSLL